MRQRFTIQAFFVASLMAMAAAPLACGLSDTMSSDGSGSGHGTGVGASGDTGGCTGFNCGQGGNAVGTLTIVPPTATITVTDGVASALDLNAQLDGQDIAPSGWVVDYSSIANVDGTGNVNATGAVGGNVTVKATYNGQTATALVTVNLKRTVNLAGLTQAQIDLLNGATTQDASVVWAYPYNHTVYPKGINAQTLMWNGGGAGDAYRIHFHGTFLDFDYYTAAEPPSQWVIDDASWTQLTESGPGGTLDLEVDRLPAGQGEATKVINHDWTIANGSMKGTVYYWANSLGRVLRIKPGAGAPEDFLANAGINDCSTCHAVSANGSTLILGGDTATSVFDLLTNTTVVSTTSVSKPVRNWAMPAVSPDGKVLVENNAALPGPPGGSDGMWDTTTVTKIPGTGLDGVFLDMPAFSPDGTKLVFVDHTTHALSVYDFDATTHVVSNPVALVEEAGTTIAFPSVSPDAKSIVYHRGSLDTRFGPGDLFLASIGTPGSETRLANIDGDGYPFAAGPRDLALNYEPTFAPLNSGGFAWVVFTSRRTYGNALTGDSSQVKQLWVAAIDQDVTPGVDPSHPAFRISGQDPATLNMRGFWALDPCKQTGDACGTGSECCNQNCDTGFCKDPNPNGCAEAGSACETAADCCDAGAECINHVCSVPPPQ